MRRSRSKRCSRSPDARAPDLAGSSPARSPIAACMTGPRRHREHGRPRPARPSRGGFAIECDVQLTRGWRGHGLPRFRARPADGRERPRRRAERRDRSAAIAAAKAATTRSRRSTDFLDRAGGRVPLVLEIKSRFDGDLRLTRRAAEVVAAYAGPVALKSFDPDIVAALRELAPTLPRGIVGEHDYSRWRLGASRRPRRSTHWPTCCISTRPGRISCPGRSRDLPQRRALSLPRRAGPAGDELDRARRRRIAPRGGRARRPDGLRGLRALSTARRRPRVRVATALKSCLPPPGTPAPTSARWRRMGCLRSTAGERCTAHDPDNPFMSPCLSAGAGGERLRRADARAGRRPISWSRTRQGSAARGCAPPTSRAIARANTSSTTAGPTPMSAPAGAIIRSSRSACPSRRRPGRACWSRQGPRAAEARADADRGAAGAARPGSRPPRSTSPSRSEAEYRGARRERASCSASTSSSTGRTTATPATTTSSARWPRASARR